MNIATLKKSPLQSASLLIWLTIVCVLVHASNKGADFHVFYLAGERALEKIALYQVADGYMPFKYHPVWAVLFSPWTLVPERFSILIFDVLQLWLWWKAIIIWARHLGYEIQTPKVRLSLLILSLSAFSAELGYGQVNGMLFYGTTIVFEYLENRPFRPVRAGLLVAMIVSLKLNFGLLFIYALMKNWRSVFGFVLGIGLLHLIVALFYRDPLSVELYRSWVTLLLDQSSTQYLNFESQGFLRFFLIAFGQSGRIGWIAAVVFFLGFGFYLTRVKVTHSAVVPCYWLAGIFLLSPLAWWYQILFLYPLIFFLLKENLPRFARLSVGVCLFCFAFCNFNTLGRQGIILFKDYQGYFACSVVLIVIFFLRIFRYMESTPTETSVGGPFSS